MMRYFRWPSRYISAHCLGALALASLVACGGGGDSDPVLSNTPSLPTAIRSSPQASTCSALRSGSYRYVANGPGSDNTGVVVIDAENLTVTDVSGSSQLVATPGAGKCRFTTDTGGNWAVSPAGVIVGQFDEAPYVGGILFPEQTHTVAELAGEWNGVTLEADGGGPRHLVGFTLPINASGKLTGAVFCDPLDSACMTAGATEVDDVTASINSVGGFNFTNATIGRTDRLFAYRAGGGELMLVVVRTSGDIGFFTRKVARTLPTVGELTTGWVIRLVPGVTPPFTSPTILSFEQTIATVDAATGGYTRTVPFNSTGDTLTESLIINNPRDGYVRRKQETVLGSDGSSQTVAGFINLPLRGMGMSAVGRLDGSDTLVLGVISAE